MAKFLDCSESKFNPDGASSATSDAPSLHPKVMVKLRHSNWKIDKANDVSRFIKAQENMYETALAEIRNGKKESHWIWFVLPQL